MKSLWVLLVLCMNPRLALADAPAPVLVESLRWSSPTSAPSLQVAWVLGAEDSPRPYLLAVFNRGFEPV